MRVAVCLGVAILAAVMVSVGVARPPRTVPSSEPYAAATAHVRDLRARRQPRGDGLSPFWRLERRYVALQHEEGRLGAEVRRLRRQVAVRRLQERLSAVATIRLVFGPTYGDQAVAVSSCETGGTFDPGARNGQYHGVLQMGTNERMTYGDSDTVLGQALAAYRYFAAVGYSWQPWTCRSTLR